MGAAVLLASGGRDLELEDRDVGCPHVCRARGRHASAHHPVLPLLLSAAAVGMAHLRVRRGSPRAPPAALISLLSSPLLCRAKCHVHHLWIGYSRRRRRSVHRSSKQDTKCPRRKWGLRVLKSLTGAAAATC